jgi:Tol biopolymer transport system component
LHRPLRAPRTILAIGAALVVAAGVLVGVLAIGDDAPTKVTAGRPKSTTTTTTGFTLGTLPPVPGTTGSTAPPRSVPRTTVTTGATTSTSVGTTTTSGPAATTTTTAAPAPLADTSPYPTGPADPLEVEHVYVVDVSDGTPHSVATQTDLLDRCMWSSDGRHLLYSVKNAGTYSLKSDGSDKHTLLGPGGVEAPDWSSQGDFAMVDYDGTGYDLLVTSASGAVRRITQADVGPVSGRAWSPDGSTIAFVAGNRVWLADADTTNVRAVTPDTGKAWKWLKWSPDGTRIAYYDSDRLLVVNADGSDLHDLAPVNADPSFDWSPDGTELVLAAPFSATPQLDIGIVSAAGGTVRSLGVQGMEMTWSPDGSTIAYKAWPLQNSAIAVGVIGADGTGQRTLLAPPKGVFFGLGLDWSPDSTHLLVNTGSPGDGGPPQP